MKNTLNWFEIPVAHMERAVAFYETLFHSKLKREVIVGVDNAIFPAEQGSVTGSLVADPHRSPSPQGTLVYLDATGSMESIVSRIEPAGGKLLSPIAPIGPFGFIATFRDTEGNIVGLHSRPQ